MRRRAVNRFCTTAAAVAALALGTDAALAGFTDLGNNWQAEWDDSLDPFVDVTQFGTMPTPDGLAIVIRKEAEFTQPSVGGVFPSIPIVFRQTGPSDVEFIVIEDEVITNSTGEDWFDFRMQLVDGNDALFDPTRTMNSGGAGPIGWDVSPFTQAEFSDDNRELDIFGGSVADGDARLHRARRRRRTLDRRQQRRQRSVHVVHAEGNADDSIAGVDRAAGAGRSCCPAAPFTPVEVTNIVVCASTETPGASAHV